MANGFSVEPPVLVEAWAYHGQPKPAQRAKVTTDAFKLLWIEREVFGGTPTPKVLSDDRAAAHFVGSSWVTRALRSFEITVLIVELPKDMRKKVSEAQNARAGSSGAGNPLAAMRRPLPANAARQRPTPRSRGAMGVEIERKFLVRDRSVLDGQPGPGISRATSRSIPSGP